MGHRGWLAFVVGFIPILLFSQSEGENIVPNASFEAYSSVPLGWFYTGRDFTRVLKYWESPTAASPDVYGPKVYVPAQWQEQGFGDMRAASGKSFVGITVYGCDEGKPHCREYVQIQLAEPLVVGQRYHVAFSVSHLPRSLCIRDIGVAFSEERQYLSLDARVELEATLEPEEIVRCSKGEWKRITGEFYAQAPASYVIIGNFKEDASSMVSKPKSGEPLPFSYYYIDDVEVKKLPPILEIAPVLELTAADLTPGDTIELNNIYFDHDRADFLPRSFLELDALVDVMKTNPDMVIEVHGHTDDVGTDEYNHELSVARANAVVEYLVTRGVEQGRLSSRGFGSTMPVNPNSSENGRQENRRVEFLVVSRS